MAQHRKADPGDLAEIHSFFSIAKTNKTIAPNVIHNWEGAIGAITHSLLPQEKNVTYLTQQLESIRNRMKQDQRNISAATIDTYINRAASAVSYYWVWKNDQKRWETEVASTAKKSFGRLAITNITIPSDLAQKKPENLTEALSHRSKNKIQLRANNGELFVIEFPEEFFMADVLRVIWALAAHAKDFDYKTLLNKMWNA